MMQNNNTSLDFDIWELNMRLQVLTLLSEDGYLYVSYLYDINRTWEEEAEGGYVVASYYLYHATDIKIKEVRDEAGIPITIEFTKDQMEQINQYLKYEIEKEQNGWN